VISFNIYQRKQRQKLVVCNNKHDDGQNSQVNHDFINDIMPMPDAHPQNAPLLHPLIIK